MAALLPFLFLVLAFEAVPLVIVIARSFMPEDAFGFTMEHYADIFTKSLYRQAVVNSVLVSVFSAVVGLAIAFLGAKAAHGSGGGTQHFFLSLLNMTSNFAGVPLAFAYIILFGNSGVLVLIGKKYGIAALAGINLYSLSGLLMVYVYFQVPLATMLLFPAFEGIRPQWRESVELLGGGGWTFWRRVGLPVLMPSLMGTLGVLFSNALAAYATAYALLQNNFSLLPIRLQEQFTGDIVQHKEFGSALAVVMMILMVLSIWTNNLILKRNRREQK